MKMKKQLYFPLLLTLLASLVFGVLPLGQATTVYAAPDYEYKKPTAFTDPGADWNLEGQAYDVATPDDQTTAADSNTGPPDADPWITFQTWDTKVETYTATELFVNWKTNGAYDNDQWGIQYTDDGGTTWYDVLALGVHNDTAIVQSSVTLATANQDLTLVQVKLVYEKLTGGDTGATYIYDIWTRGTYTPPDISNTPTSFGFGTLAEGGTYETTGGLTTAYFTVTNNSAFAVNITIGGSDMTGGVTWTLSNDGTAGTDTYGLKAGLEGGSYNVVVKRDSPYNQLVGNLLASGTQDWALQLLAPDTFTDGGLKSGAVTLTATQA